MKCIFCTETEKYNVPEYFLSPSLSKSDILCVLILRSGTGFEFKLVIAESIISCSFDGNFRRKSGANTVKKLFFYHLNNKEKYLKCFNFDKIFKVEKKSELRSQMGKTCFVKTTKKP